MRWPGWAYRRLERVYLDQRQLRRREQREAVEAEDRRYRAFCAREQEAHDSGQCADVVAGALNSRRWRP